MLMRQNTAQAVLIRRQSNPRVIRRVMTVCRRGLSTLCSPNLSRSTKLPNPPKKSYSPRKIKLSEEEKEEKKEEEKQPFDEHPTKKQQQLPTIEPLELAEEEQKYSKSPTEGQKNSYVKNMKLRSNATSHVSSSEKVLVEQGIRMDNEIQQLLKDIKQVGETGEPFVEFGDLFDDEEVANYYEALVGTLKAAKKKKLIAYDGQYLMKGVHDKVVISIL